MKYRFFLVALVICTTIFSSGCISSDDETITIGSKLFNEQYIVAHMVAQLLEDQGIDADVIEGLGGTLVNFEALKKGQIDVYLEYTGTVYNVIYKLDPPQVWDADYVYGEVEEELLASDGVIIASRTGFRDDYAIAVDRKWAEDNGVETLQELEMYAGAMNIGTDPEFATRQDGLPQVLNVYGYEFGKVSQMQPTLMYEAIKNGEVDAISAYTTDARVDMYGLVLLEDDLEAFPPYDAILIINGESAKNEVLMEVLGMLQNILDTDSMRALNYQYDEEKREARDIAHDYLISKGLLEE